MTALERVLRRPWPLPAELATTVLAFTAGLAALALLCQWLLGFEPAFTYRVLIAFAAAAAGVSALALVYLRGRPFGVANRVTLVRVALGALLVGLLIDGPGHGRYAVIAWLAIALTVVELVLDGIDGKLARRDGQTTRFGARFDLETDAALVLVLAALCWQLGKAGPWVLAAGLMRYVFVAGSRVLPLLRRELPPSRRRQTICVVQIVGLLAAISPLFPAPFSDAAALATLLALASSFAIDIAWLVRESRMG